MNESNNVSIIYDLLKIIFGVILGIFATNIFRFFRRVDSGHCIFNIPFDTKRPERHEVIIKKHFNKVYYIDCPWFDIKEINGFSEFQYPKCPHGINKEDVNGKIIGTCKFFN
ncbi:MAG: hypothetical protein ABIJ40_16405 [Bacteroidota bacterium]